MYTFPAKRRVLAIITLLSLLGGCGIFNATDPDGIGEGYTEQEIYDRAMQAADGGRRDLAIAYLQNLEAQFPFGEYAEQSQLELIYLYYRNTDYERAMDAANRFIRLHPEHPNVDYAYYMRGLISFTRDGSFLGNFVPTDLAKRDPGGARDSFAFFSELLARYPDSQYAPDARKRMIYLRNLLARYEINVANYYFRRGAYLAATNRGRYVVENFAGTPAVADGLAVMAQGYTVLGYEDLADNAVAVLRENFPDHPALDDDGELREKDILSGQQRSVVNRVTFGLFDQPEPLGYDTREMYNPEYQSGEDLFEEDEDTGKPWWRLGF